MVPEEIIDFLNKEFPMMAFSYKKKDFANKNIYEFFYEGIFNDSIMFDLDVLAEKNKEPLLIIKNAIINSIKRNELDEKRKQEKQKEDDDEEESRIKKVWKKSKKIKKTES